MISVVVPVLDEEVALTRNLPLWRKSASRPHEVVVVDGGSCDAGPRIARELGARVVEAPRGRGTQMNAGAREALGDLLLFVHADCWLDEGALDQIPSVLDREGVVAGVFRQRIEGEHWLYRGVEFAAGVRARWFRCPYGDSGLFVRREVFDRVGGFPDVPLCEDLGMARRLRPHGQIARCDSTIHVSDRRWRSRGILRTTFRNWWIALGYRAGVSPARLYRAYYGVGHDRGAESRQSCSHETGGLRG